MKRYIILSIALVAGLFIMPGTGKAQAVKTTSTSSTTVESVAQKRTERMKDELFLSIDQCAQILDINKEMLTRLNYINSQKLDRSEMNKQITALNNWTKNKIVPLLTPAQRERFESALFARIYETRVDSKKAYTQEEKKR